MTPRGSVGIVLLALSLAACQGSPATIVSPVASTVAGTPGRSVASLPATSPSPIPTSAATVARGVVDGLRSFASDAHRSYRITFTGDSRHTTDILDVSGTLDVSGEDAALTARFRFPREGTARIDYRRVGGTDWTRIDTGKWRPLRGIDAAAVVEPLAGARDPAAPVQFLGPVDGADDRYRVQLTGTVLHPALIPAVNLDDERVLRTKLTLVTDARGLPVSGSWSLSGTGRVSGQLQAIEMELDLVFSKVGAPISIKAP